MATVLPLECYRKCLVCETSFHVTPVLRDSNTRLFCDPCVTSNEKLKELVEDATIGRLIQKLPSNTGIQQVNGFWEPFLLDVKLQPMFFGAFASPLKAIKTLLDELT